jgi:hypothetical protein
MTSNVGTRRPAGNGQGLHYTRRQRSPSSATSTWLRSKLEIAGKQRWVEKDGLTYEVTNTYALRMAGVFMFSLATLSHRTGALPRPFVWGTWVLGALLVLGLTQTLWAALLFPAWVLGLSLYLLLARRRD